MVPPEKDNLVKSPVKPSCYAQMKVDSGNIGGRKFKHLPMGINFKTYICKYYSHACTLLDYYYFFILSVL